MSEENQQVIVIIVYLCLTDAAGNNQYSYLVQSYNRVTAMRTLFAYLLRTGFPTENIDRYDIEELKFGEFNVVEMLQ